MGLDRDELAARATAARAALLSLCEALSALVPVAPASGAPATEPRRTVGAVVRDGSLRHYDEDDLLIVVADDPAACQRFLDNPRRDLSLADAYPEDEFVRWATREECERHGLNYVARPLPGAPLAAPSPAATPAAWVPSVGDVVKHVSESDAVATTGQIRVVVSTNPIRWVYVENGVRKGESGPTGWGNDVRFVRRATSSERAAAGLPVDESASESAEADESHAAWMAHREATSSGAMKPGQWDSYRAGWLARARVAVKGGAS